MIGTFDCKFISESLSQEGVYTLSFAASGTEKHKAKKMAMLAREKLSNGRNALRIKVEIAREKRSLDANAYFHVLVDKIAERIGLGRDEIKRQMVLDYGTAMTYENDDDDIITISLPPKVNANIIYPYLKFIKYRTENGEVKAVYALYKQTHTLDTKEMYCLIQGTIDEAKQLEIETRTPDEILNMMDLYEKERHYGKF